jgi:hypothetical protein
LLSLSLIWPDILFASLIIGKISNSIKYCKYRTTFQTFIKVWKSNN